MQRTVYLVVSDVVLKDIGNRWQSNEHGNVHIPPGSSSSSSWMCAPVDVTWSWTQLTFNSAASLEIYIYDLRLLLVSSKHNDAAESWTFMSLPSPSSSEGCPCPKHSIHHPVDGYEAVKIPQHLPNNPRVSMARHDTSIQQYAQHPAIYTSAWYSNRNTIIGCSESKEKRKKKATMNSNEFGCRFSLEQTENIAFNR